MAPLFLSLRTWWKWVVNPQEETPVPWSWLGPTAGGRIEKIKENLSLSELKNPDRPGQPYSLCCLHYLASYY
jgi:hypothetical protein